LAASLASFNNRVPIAHVEAGLRTSDLRSPFPEEANRVLVSRLADFHFAPTEKAKRNLQREGIEPSRIFVTGNTVVDALEMVRSDVEQVSAKQITEKFGESLASRLLSGIQPMVLITAHRRESFGEGLRAIAAAVRELAVRYCEWTFVFCLHPNPNARRPPTFSLNDLSNVFLVEPIDYVPFVWLLKRSSAILTDSGGLQEEATTLGKPLLVAREVTERTEGLDFGAGRLVGTNPIRIVAGVEEAVRRPPAESWSEVRQTYGQGNAAQLIVEALASKLGCATVGAVVEFEVA
jgi:UDP-N-acetylglucosamine 2-epimerase (non-hydrolysing)